MPVSCRYFLFFVFCQTSAELFSHFSPLLSGPVTNQDFAQELMDLQQKEMKLDKLIQNCTLQIYQLFENQHTQKYPSAVSNITNSLAVLLDNLGFCAYLSSSMECKPSP